MRTDEVRFWLEGHVMAAGGDAFDRAVATHIVRVYELAHRYHARSEFSDDPLTRELNDSVKLLHARAQESELRQVATT